MLFISHDLRVVRHITHRVMVMYLGSNVEVGPTGEIFRHPAHPYTQVLTKAAPKLDPLNRRREYAIEGEPPSPINTPSGCKIPSPLSLLHRQMPPGGSRAAGDRPLATCAPVTIRSEASPQPDCAPYLNKEVAPCVYPT